MEISRTCDKLFYRCVHCGSSVYS